VPYEADSVRFGGTDIIHNVPVDHKFRNQGECSVPMIDIDCDKFQDVKVGGVHPEHRFLAKILEFGGSYVWQNRGKGPHDGTHLSDFKNVHILRDADGLHSHCPVG
jgi:hypothetical protein